MAIENGMARVNMLSTIVNGQRVSNTFYLSKQSQGSPPTLGQLTDLGAQLNTWLGTQYRAMLNTDSTLDEITVSQVPSPTAPEPVQQAVTVVAGAGTRTLPSPQGPTEACAVLSWHSPFASRKARGHIFLPPFRDAGNMSGELWNTGSGNWTAATALQTKFTAGCTTSPSWTGAELSNWSLTIWSVRAAVQGLASAYIVTSTSLSPRIHWLRSRARGTT